MKIKGDEQWMQVHHLIVDSVEAPGSWVRTTGLDGAWKVDQPRNYVMDAQDTDMKPGHTQYSGKDLEV